MLLLFSLLEEPQRLALPHRLAQRRHHYLQTARFHEDLIGEIFTRYLADLKEAVRLVLLHVYVKKDLLAI